MIAVVGWPRSGTHWMQAMLEHSLGEAMAHTHAHEEIGAEQYVLMVRDPRDIFASHWRLYQRDYPGEMAELDFVEFFLEGKGLTQPNLHLGWVAHTRKLLAWNERDPRHTSLVRFERLYAVPRITLARTLIDIGRRDLLKWRIFEAVRLARGWRYDPSGLPVDKNMGRPGKWKTQLSKHTVQALAAYCGELMAELRYCNPTGKARNGKRSL